MTFEFDSRTVMPAGLENGERVKIEYRILDSGLHLAQRVTPLTVGSRDWTTLDREMSMVPQEEGGNGMMVASTVPERGEQTERHEQMTSVTNEENETPAQERAEEQTENNNQQGGTMQEKHENMPRTASQLPWL